MELLHFERIVDAETYDDIQMSQDHGYNELGASEATSSKVKTVDFEFRSLEGGDEADAGDDAAVPNDNVRTVKPLDIVDKTMANVASDGVVTEVEWITEAIPCGDKFGPKLHTETDHSVSVGS
ncbi:hypothetical protein DVH05_022088 [Phytophthora capsici]|nr:hypothetical protein DVH05_022088 [Phytophthora capsici]